jgi:hypothetical protein
MSENINLLLHVDEEASKLNKIVKIIDYVAIAALIIICLISIIVFIMIKAVNPGAIRKQQEDVIKKISQLQDKEAKYYIVSNRVEKVEKIMKARRNFPDIVGQLLAKVPEDLSVKSFEVSKEAVTISGESKSLFSIGELIDNLTEMVHKKEIIKSLALGSLTRDDGKDIYEVTIKSEL